MNRKALILASIVLLALLFFLRRYLTYEYSPKVMLVLVANSKSPKKVSVHSNCSDGVRVKFNNSGVGAAILNSADMEINNRLDSVNVVVINESTYQQKGMDLTKNGIMVDSVKLFKSDSDAKCRIYAKVILK